VSVLAFELKLIPAPATKETLLELPFRLKFVATGTEGPMIWMLLAPVEIVILLPERTMVPVDVARLLPWMALAFATFSKGG
jgi:hypothetical protein